MRVSESPRARFVAHRYTINVRQVLGYSEFSEPDVVPVNRRNSFVLVAFSPMCGRQGSEFSSDEMGREWILGKGA